MALKLDSEPFFITARLVMRVLRTGDRLCIFNYEPENLLYYSDIF